MTRQDYEQKRVECWDDFWRETNGAINYNHEAVKVLSDALFTTFDRAYTLGREQDTITHEEIEKASVEYADNVAKQYEICNSEFVQEIMVAFEQGANFALGKQEKDAEGEEMLTVPRKKVLYMYGFNEDILICDPTHKGAKLLKAKLQELFGSKCLPDACNVASNVASKEPKYHKGEKVFYNGYVYEIEGLVGKNRYALKGLNFDLDEDMIDPCEPYTESEKESRNLSQDPANCDKHFDNILKDSFSNKRRLTIAAMAMQGILSNPKIMDSPGALDDERYIKLISFSIADAFLDECEKGGDK